MSEINVTVTSVDEQARRLVTNILGDALVEAGFGSVNLKNPADESGEFGDTMSMLDAVSQTRPELFAMPVTVITDFTDEVDDVADDAAVPETLESPVE